MSSLTMAEATANGRFVADGADVVVCARTAADVDDAGASFMASFWGIPENGRESVVGVNPGGTDSCSQATHEHLADGTDTAMNVATPGLVAQMGISADDVDRETVAPRGVPGIEELPAV
jgi:hypothetical protein